MIWIDCSREFFIIVSIVFLFSIQQLIKSKEDKADDLKLAEERKWTEMVRISEITLNLNRFLFMKIWYQFILKK